MKTGRSRGRPEGRDGPAGARRAERRRMAFRIVLGGVEHIGTSAECRLRTFGASPAAPPPVPIDAISAGHYRGEKPREGDALWALDRVVSPALLRPRSATRRPPRPSSGTPPAGSSATTTTTGPGSARPGCC